MEIFEQDSMDLIVLLFYLLFLWMLLLVNTDVFQPTGLLQFLVIQFSCRLTIQPFCCAVSFPIVCSGKVLFHLHPVAQFSSCFLHWLFSRIIFLYFVISCFACIVGSCSDIFWVSLPLQLFLAYLFQLYCLSSLPLLYFISCFIPLSLSVFLSLVCLHIHVDIFFFKSHFQSNFCFSFSFWIFFWGILILSQTTFAPA